MNTALEYTQILIWPVIAVFAMVLFRPAICAAFRTGRIKVKIFGVEIETTGEQVADVLWKNFDYFNPTANQKRLLAKLANSATPGVLKKDLKADGFDYKEDFRPLRNAGLLTGDGPTLAQSNHLQITPLGDFIVEHTKKRPNKSMEATPIRAGREIDANSGVPHA